MSILFLRLGAGFLLIDDGIARLFGTVQFVPVIHGLLVVGAGILLIVGLWTPVSGSLAAILALWSASSRSGDLRSALLLAAMSAALAMLGPGAWSVDARLFGRRRINIRDRRGYPPPPRRWYHRASQSRGPIAPPIGVVSLEEERAQCLPKGETKLMTGQSHNRRIKLKLEAVDSIHDDGLIILHIPSGRIFSSNQTGARIWQSLKQQLPLGGISTELSSDYEIDPAAVLKDVARFVTELERHGLIEEAGE